MNQLPLQTSIEMKCRKDLTGNKMKRTIITVVIIILTISSFAAASDDLANYFVRWEHGGKSYYGDLKITSAAVIFKGKKGENQTIPYLYVENVKLVDQEWFQVRSNRETGLSLGLNDVYNFQILKGEISQKLIDRVNSLVLGVKKVRVATAARLEGERSRYMVSKGETFGDDVGLLIITENELIYRSDTGGKDHKWLYSQLNGVEIESKRHINVLTKERALVKLGLSYRNYAFFSQVEPLRTEDIGFIVTRIAEMKK